MCEKSVSWLAWSRYFANRQHRPAPSIEACDTTAAMPRSLARSLAIFQLGESGGGSVIEQAKRSTLAGVDAHYAEAVALFVQEEHRHAEILARCVQLLGGQLISSNWTARWFVRCRRLLGLRCKIMVLLAAEVTGLCYYHLLASKLAGCDIGDALAAMVEDERTHLRFHCSFLSQQLSSPWRRGVFLLCWRVTMLAAALAVFIDHYPAIRDMGISRSVLWRRWRLYSRLAEQRVIGEQEPRGAVPAT